MMIRALSNDLKWVLEKMRESGVAREENKVIIRTFRWYTETRPEIMDEVLLMGLSEGLRRVSVTPREREAKSASMREARERSKRHRELEEEYAKKHGIPVSKVGEHRVSSAMREMSEMVEKAEALDRIIGMLDVWMVHGKRLGDCDKTDLLKAAASDQAEGRALVANAQVYNRLAQLLSAGEKLRECNKRGAIIEILKSTLDERNAA